MRNLKGKIQKMMSKDQKSDGVPGNEAAAGREKEQEVPAEKKKISRITDKEGDFEDLADGNRLAGERPALVNSNINFKGKNNILYCGEGVKLVNSTLAFNGSDSIIYLSGSKREYRLNISINHNSACHMGKDNYMNGTLNIVLSEQRHCYIGSECLFSFGIWIRNADPHLIYSAETMERINPTKSVFIGDHVWVGQSAMILKGTRIQAGSILGAMGVAAGKEIPANTSWGGNPAKLLKENIFWDGACVHAWKEENTEKNQVYKDDRHIYRGRPEGNVDFGKMDERLNSLRTAAEKLDYFLELGK